MEENENEKEIKNPINSRYINNNHIIKNSFDNNNNNQIYWNYNTC